MSLGLEDNRLQLLDDDISVLLARQNPNDFNEYVFGWDQQDFQREWQDMLYHPTYNPEGDQNVLVMAPRDHGKSSQWTIGRCLWELGDNPNLRIKIISQSDEKAADRLFEIVEHLDGNERLHRVFPDLKPAAKGAWTKHKIIVQRDRKMADASIEALGITSTATGGRADLEIFDDPVDFRNAIQYPAMRQVIKQGFYSVWVNLMEPEGRMIYIGTAWHLADLTHELLANPEYNSRVYTAIQEDGSVLWPNKWSREALEKRRRAIGSREFDRQFQNKALSAEEQPLPREVVETCFDYTLEWGKIYPWMKGLPRYTGVDLAIGQKKENAYTVFFTFVYDQENRQKIPLDIVHRKMTSPETVRQLLEHYDHHLPRIVFVENNAYQQALIDWVKEFDRSITIRPFTTGGNKADLETGVPGMAVEFENSVWRIPSAGEHSQGCQCPRCLWVDEMTTYPIGKSKDILMASWFSGEGVRKRGSHGSGVSVVGNLTDVFAHRSRSRRGGGLRDFGKPSRYGRRPSSRF